MSRHRNVRHLVAEEDYYDDYGDDGYGDYDDPPLAAKKKKKKKKKEKEAAVVAAVGATPTANATAAPAAASNKASSISTPPRVPKTSADAKLSVVAAPPPLSPPRSATKAAAATSSATSLRHPPTVLPPASVTCVILGHVDAGKSTLTGQLLWSSGAHGASSHRRPPANLAWLLDEDEQERAHGVTMEVATQVLPQVTPTNALQIVLADAPGHADFVPAMITGTASADAAVVVVDATNVATSLGTRGQLREHLVLAKGLGIAQVIVAVNKLDVLAWSQEAFETLVAALTVVLKDVGYPRVAFVPLSGLTGVNVYQKATEPALTAWYSGPTLWQCLDALEAPTLGPKALTKPLRLVVTDVMGEQGRGGVAVRTKVAAGFCRVGEALEVLPVHDVTKIHKLTHLPQASGGSPPDATNGGGTQDYAVMGQVVDLVLTGLDVSRIATGNVLGRPAALPRLTTRCRCKIFVLEGLALPLIRGAQALWHMHSLDVPCHLSHLEATLKPNGSVLKERPRVLTAKTQAIVEVTLHYPIALEVGKALGRFVLRRSGATIAVGRVEEVLL
jgi:elongation factor 1 alpha-like protein